MRPHHLEVTAFGAFASTVAVDFDALSAAGLFLLHGQTGAGKTTLLDAIAFALYGRVPGPRGTARRLRSDHAGQAARTQVRLEATIGGRRLRVTRCPEQTRPKKRGTGTTTQPATVLLEEHTGGQWRTVSTRAGEADEEIGTHLGMSADQFFQVVLLPQGEFARFLRADSTERAALLERLFATGRFRDVETWLAEQRRSSAATIEGTRARLATLSARVAQVAEVDPPEGDPPAWWATDLACQADAATARTVETADAAGARLEEARHERDEAQRAQQRCARREAAEANLATLTDAEPAITELAAELTAADRATAVAALLRELDEAGQNLGTCRAAVDDARVQVREARGPDEADASGLQAAQAAAEQRSGMLEGLRELAEAVDAEQATAASARADAAAAGRDVAAASRDVAELTEQQTRRRRDRETARTAARDLPPARAEADRAGAAVRAAHAHRDADADAERLRAEHLHARERAQDLREIAQRLRQERIDGMVAELAARLTDGAPCPVCGSVDHPDRAEIRAEPVSREQEDGAGRDADAARAAAEEVGARAAAARARVEEASDRLTGLGVAGPHDDLDVEALREHAEHAEAAAASMAERAETAERTDAELTDLDERLAEADRRAVAAGHQRESADREAEAAARRAAAARATLAERLDGAPDLDAALAAATATAAACRTAADAVHAATRAEADLERVRRAVVGAATDAGFADGEHAAASLRDDAWREQARDRLTSHREGLAAARALLDDPELAEAGGLDAEQTRRRVQAADAAIDDARGTHEEAVGHRDRSRHRAEQLARLAPQCEQARETLGPQLERAEEIRGLADLAAGHGANTLRMTLSAFVLAARLEEVAAAASQRLTRMTAGRYSLVHTDAGRGNRRSGLGLLARDAWTGQDRDTATLSGGETFLTSLALALGLADVVCAEAGGARLEALFIDEGFGTLDEDTLEEVMNTLDGLREGGRVVGLVSHVGELRQRIPAQVHVRKTRAGSDVTVLGWDDVVGA